MESAIPRLYATILSEHLRTNRQMAFVSGPRQVGKTTICKGLAGKARTLNWDNPTDRQNILAGPHRIAELLDIDQLSPQPRVIAFDELHKYARWKSFLKGFFDSHSPEVRILVTGSSRLDVFRRGGDSLMGRYFLFRMHPLSVGELLDVTVPLKISSLPKPLEKADWDALWEHGGYPEPFSKRNATFSRRWQSTRRNQLLREEVRDLTQIHELTQLEALAIILAGRSGQQLVYGNLAKDVQVSADTAKRWIETLCSLHFGFLVRPWFQNVAKAIRKEPKWYLRDWAEIEDAGARAETFMACHLLKAVEGWTDLGLGNFELRHVRDKDQREVDFVVIRDGKPWFLVEVKTSETKLSPSLAYFHDQLKTKHAFQVVTDLQYVNADCFATGRPTVVPAKTFLSQLL